MPTSDPGKEAAPFDRNKLTKLYDFGGQTVVVTGGTGVLGGEMAIALAKCGANVVILGRNLDAGQAILARMGDAANHAALISCDILDRASIEKAAAEVISKFKSIDHLI